MTEIGVAEVAEVAGWARESGKIAQGYFNNVLGQRKADNSYVTQADFEIEQFLRDKIGAHYPQHGIVGEEQGSANLDAEFVWALDPIDGTGSFLAGLPTWSISIGLLRHGMPWLGVVYMPLLDDLYSAVAGGPALRNEQPIAVESSPKIQSNHWIAISSYAHRRFTIDFPAKTRILGSVASELCYVARGSAVGSLIGRAKTWDVAAGLAILRAAGGALCTLDGSPIDEQRILVDGHLPETIVAGAPQLHEAIRKSVKRR